MTKKTVKLTGRRPVTFDKKQWPVIAKASDFKGGSGHACQANEEAWVVVRRHADGRHLIYGMRDSGPGGMHMGYRGVSVGDLLEASESCDLNTAINEVVEGLGDGWEHLADECIGALPAEDI